MSILQVDDQGRVFAQAIDHLHGLGPDAGLNREARRLKRRALHFQKEHNPVTLLANHILLRMKNVIIMPHSAFNARDPLTIVN